VSNLYFLTNRGRPSTGEQKKTVPWESGTSLFPRGLGLKQPGKYRLDIKALYLIYKVNITISNIDLENKYYTTIINAVISQKSTAGWKIFISGRNRTKKFQMKAGRLFRSRGWNYL
jgi:hypothetical protein